MFSCSTWNSKLQSYSVQQYLIVLCSHRVIDQQTIQLFVGECTPLVILTQCVTTPS